MNEWLWTKTSPGFYITEKYYQNIFKPSRYRLQFRNKGNYWYDNVLYKKRTLSNIYTEKLHIRCKNTETRQYVQKLSTENSLVFN